MKICRPNHLIRILNCYFTLAMTAGSVPGPWILPFCGSAPFMLLVDTQMLNYPYRLGQGSGKGVMVIPLFALRWWGRGGLGLISLPPV